MGYVGPTIVSPGDTTDATENGQFLDDVEALVVETVNLRTEALAAPHFDVTRDSTPAAAVLATIAWIDTISATGTSTHGSVDPGTLVSPGGTDMELEPASVNLQTGDVLRWHFGCLVDSVDFSGSLDNDRYYVEVLITGTDLNGSAVKGAGDSQELGIIGGFSMNTGGIDSGGVGDGTDKELSMQRIHVSGWYIHDGEFTPAGGDVRIDAIQVNIYVQDAANSVTVSNATLTAMVCKG